jgi:dipeptidyl aminopeptidase/acylaminoacyl peptidase
MKYSLLFLLAVAAIGCNPQPQQPPPAQKAQQSAAESKVVKGHDTPDSDYPNNDHETSPMANNPAPEKTAAKDPANGPPGQAAGETPLIPRIRFFGNPEKARARLSSDGKRLAYLAPVEGVLNVWVGPADDVEAAKPVTNDTHRGIRNFFWAYTNKHILYTQDKDGDEDFHVYGVDLESGEINDLTPLEKINAQIDGVSERFPEEILVGLNDRDKRFHDIYRVNVVTGDRELVQENEGFAGFVTDDDYRVRFAVTFTAEGGQLYLQRDDDDKWTKEFMAIDPLDAMTTSLAGFDRTGENVYLIDSRDRDTAALKVLNLESGEEKVLAENEKADISGALVHPTKKTIQAASFTYTRPEWVVLDDDIQADLDYLKTVADGELQVTGRTLDDKWWTVAYLMDNGPARFYIYDRDNKSTRFLFVSDRQLAELPLVKMHPVVLKTRDDLSLVCYLTLPRDADPQGTGRPTKPLPLVLNVHGGPWARDDWGYDPEHQLLANRGYAVLSVNYRGSTGFGKAFINVADREWAGRMHDDLIDAVNWAVEEKIAEKDKVGIMGGSYGGYATLVGLTFTPDVFACGVDLVGPSSLITLLENPPEYWYSFMPVMKRRVGDWETEEGRDFLISRSPLFHVEKIRRPLLIGQGANDPRVKQAEADQIVAAMEERMIPVTYVLFQEEGHGFAKPQNRFAFYAITEAFLAEHLGGRFEPVGDAFRGAVFTVPAGKDEVPGLAEALSGKAE